MQTRLLLAAALLVFGAIPAIAAPDAYIFDAVQAKGAKNEVSFTSKAAIVKVTARTSDLSGQASFPLENMAKASCAINVDLSSLNMGTMTGTLETKKYNSAIFKFTSIQVPGNKLKANTPISGNATGQITLHGVTRPVTAPIELTYLPKKDKSWVELHSAFKVKLSDHNVAKKGFMMSDELAIDINVMAKAH